MSRDSEFDRLLRSALPGELTPASEACLDADTLAAWSDGALSSARAVDVERHLSTCSRCQVMMAVFARSAASAPAARPFWQRFSSGWLIPVAAAGGLALVIWMMMPKDQRGPVAVSEQARVQERQAVPPSPPPSSTSTAPAGLTSKSTTEQSRASSPRAESRKPVAPNAAPVEAPAELRPQPLRPQPIAGSAAVTPAPDRPMPPPAPVPIPTSTQTVQTPPPPPPPPPPATPPPPQATNVRAGEVAGGLRSFNEQVTVDALEVERPLFEVRSTNPSPQQVGFAGGGAGRGGGGRGRGDSTAAISQRPLIEAESRWRVFTSGRVERSTDNGATWKPTTIEPRPTGVTAGSSPSPTICWLVGRLGLVLLTTDGTTFRNITFPEPIGLVSIQAIDAFRAMVTAADGRVFETTDGGATWRN